MGGGGLLFLWVTTRRREVGLGYGWLLRGIYGVMAAGAVAAGLRLGTRAGARRRRLGVVVAAGVALGGRRSCGARRGVAGQRGWRSGAAPRVARR